MLCEYSYELGKMYLYDRGLSEVPKDYLTEDSLKLEKIGKLNIYSGKPIIEIKKVAIKMQDLTKASLKIKCVHGKYFLHKVSKILPEDGWEELIDFWICCQGENNIILSKEIPIKKETMLISDFYFYTTNSSTPKCCIENFEKSKGFIKVFYNQILWDIEDNSLLYRYLRLFFRRKNVFLFKHNGNKYEVKFFCKTFLCTKSDKNFLLKESMKIGIKLTEKLVNARDNFNDYFNDKMYYFLTKSLLEIDICGYNLSFISDGQ